MNRPRWFLTLTLSLLLIGPMAWLPDARADTCETRAVTETADFPLNKPAPMICNPNGHLRVETGKATSVAPGITNGTYTGWSFDLNGNARVTLADGSLDNLGTATEVAPTITEGAGTSFSFDLSGNARVTLGTLISGEDTTNNLLRTSGGAARVTQLVGTGGVPSTATDEAWPTAGPTTLPTGMKTFQGVVTCTGTCIQTQKIYGSHTNNETVGTATLVCTLSMNASTTASDWCKTDFNFSYWWAVTSGSAGTTPLAGLFVYY